MWSLRQRWKRWWIVLGPSLLVAAFGLLVAGLAAQDAGKKPPKEEEEEEVKKPVKQPPKEEEEKVPPKAKPPLRVEDDEPDSKPPKPADRRETDEGTALAQEARQATHPEVKKLFLALAVPHDLITFSSGRRRNIKPVSQYVGDEPAFQGELKIQPYDDNWRPEQPYPVKAKQVRQIDHYEQLALRKVDDLLDKSGLERAPPASKRHLPRPAMLEAARKVLEAVLTWHQSAKEQGQREGNRWQEVEKSLKNKLLGVQLEVLQNLSPAKDWDSGFALGRQLLDLYPSSPKVQAEFAKFMAAHAQQALQAKDDIEAARTLRLLEDQVPDSKEGRAIQLSLRSKAQAKLDQAKATKDPEKALPLLDEAEKIWPRLEGLRAYRLIVSNAYPVLYVGVKELPVNLSPATAGSDAERQACELLFESLFRPYYSRETGQRYDLGLAGERPQLLPLGRKLALSRDAYWSSGERVTAVDVASTVALLGKAGRKTPVDDARSGEDAYHLSVILEQGFLDPLSSMTFKILPASQRLSQIDDSSFARHPVGSGPFVYQGQEEKENVSYSVFKANPYYHPLTRPGRPYIQEIRFFHSDNPAAEFGKQPVRLHLLLDLPTIDIKSVETVEGVRVRKPLRNLRIYFLAVNHRRPELRNPHLRRAIGVAIDRDKILNDVFRAGYKDEHGKQPHRPLNGPYPPGSWPCDPNLRAFDTKLARGEGELARRELSAIKTLTLKYPLDDRQALQACEALRTQIHDQTGIELVLEPGKREDLRQEVEVKHDYELAYYHYDYPSEAYWLWPLFDPSQRAIDDLGGRNYLGYKDEIGLGLLLRQVNGHRDLKELKRLTHQIHKLFQEQMPFIPLWQLDTHIAVHKDLTSLYEDPPRVPIDPLRIFNNVDEWKLEAH